MTGTAASYEIRYLPGATWLDESNWDSALPAVPYSEPIPTPEPAGTLQTFTFAILEPDTDYAFGIRVLDEAGNVSPVASTSVRTASLPPSAWKLETVDSGGDQFAFCLSMALDSDGLPGIAYSSSGNSELAFARWNRSGWELQVVDASTRSVDSIDVAFSPNDLPAVSYDANYRTLTVARRTGAFWSLESVAPISKSSRSTALVFGLDGHPMIAYLSGSKTTELVLARSNGSSWGLETVERGVGAQYIGLTLDPQGNPAIAYSDGGLKIAEAGSGGWNIELVDTGIPQDVAGIFAGVAYDPVAQDFVLVDQADEANVDSGGVRYLQRDALGWFEELVGHDRNGYVYASSPSLAFDSTGKLRRRLRNALLCVPVRQLRQSLGRRNGSGGNWRPVDDNSQDRPD